MKSFGEYRNLDEAKVISGGYRDKNGVYHAPKTAESIAKEKAAQQRKIADAMRKEEVEDLEELNKDTLTSYQDKADADITRKHRVLGPQIKAGDAKAANKTADTIQKRMTGIDRAVTRLNKEETEMDLMSKYVAAISKDVSYTNLDEKTLTPAELKKREEVAKAMERETPGMDKSKKMAIATATAKRVAEEAELDEASDELTQRMTSTQNKTPAGKERERLRNQQYVKTMMKLTKAKGGLTGPKDKLPEEAKPHTVPKTAKEKSLAALAEPKDKITHADVMVGRGVKKEEVVKEAMISYSDFNNKIAMHRKAGNKIVDDKYKSDKASYTVVDKEGVGKKITHTETGMKQLHLGNMKGDDDEAAETAPAEKRGRGRPAGSKSGARRHN